MSDRGQGKSPARQTRGISPIFLLVLAVFAGIWWELATGRGGAIGVFAFVFMGWIISLCLHEWGHAVAAWFGGDRGVAEFGYLTLNPAKYANPFVSLILPLAFLAVGGIGLPGGAVYVNTQALRGTGWRVAVSAAGPAMNFVFLIVIALAARFAPMSDALAGALAFLAFVQATAFILNLLPIPGLDGFGIIEPFFPEHERAAMAQIGSWVSLLFFVLILSVPQLLAPVWNVAQILSNAVGVDSGEIIYGYGLFRFWDAG